MSDAAQPEVSGPQNSDDPLLFFRAYFTFIAWGHRGLENHTTWACNGCGCVVVQQMLPVHYAACDQLTAPEGGSE